MAKKVSEKCKVYYICILREPGIFLQGVNATEEFQQTAFLWKTSKIQMAALQNSATNVATKSQKLEKCL